MKSQQQAEREEQQRIKNLVLNYDMQQSDEAEGMIILPQKIQLTNANKIEADNDKPTTFYHNRIEKGGKDRGQRIRKLQLSDVDW